jgi:hypothetical protein
MSIAAMLWCQHTLTSSREPPIEPARRSIAMRARVAELADALDLGSSG